MQPFYLSMFKHGNTNFKIQFPKVGKNVFFLIFVKIKSICIRYHLCFQEEEKKELATFLFDMLVILCMCAAPLNSLRAAFTELW